MKESSAEIWFKVEMVHWVMEDSRAKDNLNLSCLKSKHTLNQVTKALGIGERHVRKLFRGKVTFETKSRKKAEETTREESSKSDIGEEPEYEIMDSIGEVDNLEIITEEKEQPEKAKTITTKKEQPEKLRPSQQHRNHQKKLQMSYQQQKRKNQASQYQFKTALLRN
ncbi:Hypothetical predicted protein [Mytilus galloprovincialis]|uniref:Uncharacterized protein n=1 Tax=Mytilus galloprovincialis TaxID=29158 RepID=A0A8B6H1R7_MYTGA|nr:Hypothetical predicted protein [Mytilus galloprovincialis]